MTHNAVELLRERGPEVGFKARDLHQKRLQACAHITLRWMEPFSLELWLKAVIQEQQGPNAALKSKDDDHPHTHHLSNLWKKIENPLKTLIEKTHEQFRGQVDAITELLLMRQVFPAKNTAGEWTHEDVMLIKAPEQLPATAGPRRMTSAVETERGCDANDQTGVRSRHVGAVLNLNHGFFGLLEAGLATKLVHPMPAAMNPSPSTWATR